MMNLNINGYDKDFRLLEGRQGYLTEQEARKLIIQTIKSSSWYPQYQEDVLKNSDDARIYDKLVEIEGNTLVFEHLDRHRLSFTIAQVIPFDTKQNKWTTLRTKDGLQNIHTPHALCRDQIAKLKEFTSDVSNLTFIVAFNLEYLPVLISDFNVPASQITFLADCDRKAEESAIKYRVENIHRIGYNIKEKERIKIMPKIIKQHDVLITNPPYALPNDRDMDAGGQLGSGHSLWDQFISLFLRGGYIKENGFLVAIHPPKWRKPDHKLYSLFVSHYILYLEMHNKKDGDTVFGATTPFDWYIMQNIESKGLTTIKDINGKVSQLNIQNMSFLPNTDFELVQHLLATDDDNRCKVLYGSDYGTCHPWMRETEGDQYKYPCVHSTPNKGVRYWYSSKRKTFFDIPKVIFGYTDTIQNVVIDMDGEYGITDISIGIKVSSQEEAENIKKALESPRFNNFLKSSCRWSQMRIEWRMFRNFRQDFWKIFV